MANIMWSKAHRKAVGIALREKFLASQEAAYQRTKERIGASPAPEPQLEHRSVYYDYASQTYKEETIMGKTADSVSAQAKHEMNIAKMEAMYREIEKAQQVSSASTAYSGAVIGTHIMAGGHVSYDQDAQVWVDINTGKVVAYKEGGLVVPVAQELPLTLDVHDSGTTIAHLQREGSDWYIVGRTFDDGTSHRYDAPTGGKESCNLTTCDSRETWKKLIDEALAQYKAGTTGLDQKPEPPKPAWTQERQEIYNSLVEKVGKIERLLGLSGEAKADDLLMALAERIEEIEAELENR